MFRQTVLRGDSLIVQRDEHYKFKAICLLVVCFTVVLIYVIGFNTSFATALLINSPIFIVLIPALIAEGRTFLLDKDGCTVCFGKYRKKYLWNELKTKRIEEHDLPTMLRGRFSPPYLKEAIFSPFKIHKPKMIRANVYCLFHPFSCIYINFALKDVKYENGRHYEVDEEEFIEKMNQWSVTLEKR